ncbi:hypothetical protein [Paenibacillus prosopidis]|uniref:Uncharacterized protein n=1 Tax=Paenibacillus prosopidis TaxID=630520 RepID=A0A368VSS4_9BACL|nr:hypothetical protein [Paenibacillus prosopidis]RCW44224.1 hypothetical protein DFP97_11288 [Paenibacillus prosopidis]
MDEDVINIFEENDFPNEEIEDTNDNESEGEEEEDETEETDGEEDAKENDTDDDDEEESEEEEDTTPKTYRLKTKENHQEVEAEYSEEELVSLVQKGKDYERVKQQVNDYKNDPRLTFIGRLANEQNMTVEQYIRWHDDQQYKNQLEELLDAGVPEDVAKEVVETRRNKNTPEPEQTQDEKDLQEFLTYYTKVNGREFGESDTLPADVVKAVQSGTPLKIAYMEHLIEQKEQAKTEQKKQAEKQEKKQEHKEKVKQKAPVKGVGKNGNGKSPKKDALFDGLFDE